MKINFKGFFSKLWQKIKNFNIQDCRVSFIKGMENLQANGRALFVTIILAVVVMLLTCCFFCNCKRSGKGFGSRS